MYGQPRTLAEAILEAPGQVLHVPHAASARGLSPDGLLAPLVCKEEGEQC